MYAAIQCNNVKYYNNTNVNTRPRAGNGKTFGNPLLYLCLLARRPIGAESRPPEYRIFVFSRYLLPSLYTRAVDWPVAERLIKPISAKVSCVRQLQTYRLRAVFFACALRKVPSKAREKAYNVYGGNCIQHLVHSYELSIDIV